MQVEEKNNKREEERPCDGSPRPGMNMATKPKTNSHEYTYSMCLVYVSRKIETHTHARCLEQTVTLVLQIDQYSYLVCTYSGVSIYVVE